MGDPVIKKEQYFFFLEAGIPYEGWVDFGDGKIAWALKEVQIVGVPFNKYNHQFLKSRNVSVCVINQGTTQTDEYYKVKLGDTLSKVAAKYKVTVSDLVKWNKIADPDKIETGQKLIVKKLSETKDSSNQTKTSDNDVITIVGMAGAYSSTIAGVHYTEYLWGGGYWIGKNGKMYDMSILSTAKGNGWMYQNSANLAKNTTKIPRIFGNTIGVLTTLYSGWQFYDNPTFGNGLSVGEGIGGLLFWPFGLADSYVRFGTDIVVPDVRRHQLEMLERIDKGTFSPWDHRNVYPNLTGPCP